MLHPVRPRILEDRARAPEVYRMTLLARQVECGNGCHVDDDLWSRFAKDLPGRALSDVQLVEPQGRVDPRAPVDADALVLVAEQMASELAGDRSGSAHEQHSHRALSVSE